MVWLERLSKVHNVFLRDVVFQSVAQTNLEKGNQSSLNRSQTYEVAIICLEALPLLLSIYLSVASIYYVNGSLEEHF